MLETLGQIKYIIKINFTCLIFFFFLMWPGFKSALTLSALPSWSLLPLGARMAGRASEPGQSGFEPRSTIYELFLPE